MKKHSDIKNKFVDIGMDITTKMYPGFELPNIIFTIGITVNTQKSMKTIIKSIELIIKRPEYLLFILNDSFFY